MKTAATNARRPPMISTPSAQRSSPPAQAHANVTTVRPSAGTVALTTAEASPSRVVARSSESLPIYARGLVVAVAEYRVDTEAGPNVCLAGTQSSPISRPDIVSAGRWFSGHTKALTKRFLAHARANMKARLDPVRANAPAGRQFRDRTLCPLIVGALRRGERQRSTRTGFMA